MLAERAQVPTASGARFTRGTLDCVARDQPAAETGPPLPAPAYAILARGVSLPVQGGPVPSAATLIPAPAGKGTTESSALGGRKLADGGYR